MNRRHHRTALAGMAMIAAMQACEPASVTEAEELLGRNGGVVSFQFPVTDTTYLISDLLAGTVDTITTPEGILGVRVQADTLSAVSFTDQLQTTEVATTVAFPSPVFAAPGDTRDTVRFGTGQGSDVVAATVQSGYVVRSISNNTGCTGSATSTVRDSTGATVVTFPAVNVSSGSTFVDSVSLANASMVGFADIEGSGSIVGPCVPVPGSKITSSITVRALTLASVTLDNVMETINVEQSVELDRAELSLDDLEDAVLDAALNDATVDLVVANTADIQVVLDSFFIVAVQLDGSGNLMRDGMGNLQFETDSSTGGRLEAAIADSGLTTLTVNRTETTNVSIQAAAVMDRMIDLLILNQRVALVAIGNATAGDGSRSTIAITDDVEVQFDVVLGLDFTLPATGVTVTRNQSSDGLDLDSADIAEISSRVVTAGMQAGVENSTPFGVEVEIGLVPGNLGTNADVFAEPNVVLLSPVVVSAPPTDSVGVPTGFAADSINLGLSGTQSEVVLGPEFTAGIRFRLLPRSGPGGTRGAITPPAGIMIDASVLLEVRRGTGN